MKRFFLFLTKLIAVALSTLLLFFSLCTWIWLGLPSYYQENYQKGLVKQYRALQNSDPNKPKILVLGDSQMAFSVDSAQLSSLTGMPCYTLGMQGGMGKQYIFDLAKPYIHEGDIVIHPYTGYFKYFVGADLILLSVENEPDLYFDFLLRHPFDALSRLQERCVSKTVYTIRGDVEGEGVDFYKADAFDEMGNLTFYRPYNRYTSSLEESDHVNFWAGMWNDYDFDAVNSYADYCRNLGATFYLTSGAYYKDHVDATDEAMELFEIWFKSKVNSPVICEHWSDNFYQKKYMYDNSIHMNSNGAKLYTKNLYEDLLPYLS